MTKRILVCAVLLVLSATPVHAQLRYQSSSLKNALVEYLYQYGKETFYRGVDPQEASFILQRALVLDCDHRGAQAFLNKVHSKYPDVSVRIWGCEKEEPAAVTAVEPPENSLRAARIAETGRGDLRQDVQEAEEKVDALEEDLDVKEQVIADYKEELSAKKSQAEPSRDLEYATLAQDQKDLIRIQQNNIDYLKNELVEAKKQMQTGAPDNHAYLKQQMDLAAADLEAHEQKLVVEDKEVEAKDLRKKLTDLQEQLALVQKLVDEKNRTIESLEQELKPGEQAKR
jgi:hypothetical protein